MNATALIILNYNGCADTLACVKSVLEHNSAPVKFAIVDNASRPEQRQALQAGLQEIFGDRLQVASPGQSALESLATLILNDDNSGYARGNNVGLEAAYACDEVDYVMVLNNDVLFVEDIIPPLIAKLEALPGCAIISPLLYKSVELKEYDINCARRGERVSEIIGKNFLHYWRRLRKRTPDQVYPHRYLLNGCVQTEGEIEIELPSGSCMLVRKDLMREIGSFDPNTFLYYEENILSAKISALGKKNYLSLDQRCVHLGAATTSSSGGLFINKVGMDSQRYYVRQYSGAGPVLRAIHWLSTHFFILSLRLQKAVAPSKSKK